MDEQVVNTTRINVLARSTRKFEVFNNLPRPRHSFTKLPEGNLKTMSLLIPTAIPARPPRRKMHRLCSYCRTYLSRHNGSFTAVYRNLRHSSNRLPMLAGIILLSGDLIAAPLAMRIWHLYLPQGVLVGLGIAPM